MTKERELFRNFLKDKGLKLTPQREQIMDIFLKTDKHLSAEGLYGIVKKKNPAIGQSTVFRTLKLLCEAGLAREVNLGDKVVRFEHLYGHAHHDHLVCLVCGNCIEAVDYRIEKYQEELCRKLGFELKRHQLEIFGVCRQCKNKEERKTKKR